MSQEDLDRLGITPEEHRAMDPDYTPELTEDEFWALAVLLFDGEEP